MKKIIAAFLTVVLLLALASTALAAPASFPDIKDQNLMREVAVLQMLGAVGGDGNGNFVPDGTLTRAAFCKMAVITMGRGGEEPLFRNRTIFRDVRAGHWARGYINIAVTGENKIIAGSGGYFMPDANISYAEAVTILMRMLGYTDADAGMLWPDGYMTLAYDTGLTAGMAVSSWMAPLTRAQAAHLFYNLLGTPKKGGGSYISSLGTAAENVVIKELGVRASDGSGNAIRTSQGIIKSASGVVPPGILGQRGTLLTDKSGKALAFLPDRNSKTITVSQISGAWIKDPDGVRYDIDAKAPAYTASEDDDFGNMFFKIAVGARVTLFYSADGKIEGVFVNTSKADGAIVAGVSASVGSFGWLTGGDTGYSILKNGAPASMSDIKQYDVVTYDKSARILNVTDFRLAGYYENCWPNQSSPSKITVMGHEFPVLPSAIDSLAQYKLGQVITLLLTTDNQVAGAATTGVSGSTAVGIVRADITTSKATVDLLNGLVLSGDPKLTDSAAAQYAGELVTVSSYTTGQISLSKLGTSGATGELDLGKLTLGTAALSPAVKIFERVGTGAVAQISLSDLTQTKVSAAKVVYARKDYAGRVDLLVLNDVTGDRYEYGILMETTETSQEGTFSVSNRYISVKNSENKTGSAKIITGMAFTNGAPGGLVLSADKSKVEAVVTLTEVKNVSRTAFYTVGDKTYLHLPNMDIMVSDKVECYNRQGKSWFEGLDNARAFAETLTVYYDRTPAEGGKIRMVVAG